MLSTNLLPLRAWESEFWCLGIIFIMLKQEVFNMQVIVKFIYKQN